MAGYCFSQVEEILSCENLMFLNGTYSGDIPQDTNCYFPQTASTFQFFYQSYINDGQLCNNSSFATTQPSCKRVIHDSVTSFLTFSSECFTDDSRGLFDGLLCNKTMGIAPGFSVDLGFKPRIFAFKSHLQQSGVKCSQHILESFEMTRSTCEIFTSHCDCRASSLGEQWQDTLAVYLESLSQSIAAQYTIFQLESNRNKYSSKGQSTAKNRQKNKLKQLMLLYLYIPSCVSQEFNPLQRTYKQKFNTNFKVLFPFGLFVTLLTVCIIVHAIAKSRLQMHC